MEPGKCVVHCPAESILLLTLFTSRVFLEMPSQQQGHTAEVRSGTAAKNYTEKKGPSQEEGRGKKNNFQASNFSTSTQVPDGVFQVTSCTAEGLMSYFSGKIRKLPCQTCMTRTQVWKTKESFLTHCHRRKVCLFPPELQPQPHFSSCRSCHFAPKKRTLRTCHILQITGSGVASLQ